MVEIHESADGCGPWPGVVPPTRSVLSVTIARPESTSITPDRYPIAQAVAIDHAWVTYSHQEPAGNVMFPGISGTFDLVHLSDSAAEGSLDVTLIDGTRLEGEFSAGPCPGP